MAGSSNKNKRTAGSKNVTRKNTGTRRKSTKKSDDTMKLLLVLVIAVIAIAIVFFMQKGEDTPTGGQATVTPGLTATPEPEKPEATPTGEAEPTLPEKPDVTPGPVPTEGAELPAKISPEEARELLAEVVDTGIYKLELLNDHLAIDGAGFYQFSVSENGTDLTPLLIVDKVDGTIWCYDGLGGIEEFEKFPVDNSEDNTGTEVPGPSTEDGITAEQAYDVLCSYSKEKLGLAKEVREYTPEYDSTLTLVKGVNCYRINLTEVSNGKVRNRGEFYISIDGKQCFFIDSNLNDFVPVE